MSDGIANLLDHSLLHPTLSDEEIRQGCELAKKLGVATVCVKPFAVELAAQVLAGSKVGVGTVIGFPHGSHATETKAFEAELACQHGAVELDMVVNVGKVLQQDWDYVARDLQVVVDIGHAHDALVKVIFETDFVQDDALKIKLCQICEEVGADFVKTSTGFGFVKRPDGNFNYTGATEHDVKLMIENCPGGLEVKASGGVRTYQDACKMRDLGAKRLGTSASQAIIAGEGSGAEGY